MRTSIFPKTEARQLLPRIRIRSECAEMDFTRHASAWGVGTQVDGSHFPTPDYIKKINYIKYKIYIKNKPRVQTIGL